MCLKFSGLWLRCFLWPTLAPVDSMVNIRHAGSDLSVGLMGNVRRLLPSSIGWLCRPDDALSRACLGFSVLPSRPVRFRLYSNQVYGLQLFLWPLRGSHCRSFLALVSNVRFPAPVAGCCFICWDRERFLQYFPSCYCNKYRGESPSSDPIFGPLLRLIKRAKNKNKQKTPQPPLSFPSISI